MFTGIIEKTAKILDLKIKSSNLHIYLENSFDENLKIGQSISHNGACLSVSEIGEDFYVVAAVKETLDRSNFGNAKVGDLVNLERAIRVNDRFEGHVVQGHVDLKAKIKEIEKREGSWLFHFSYESSSYVAMTVEKGSISINGVSLTILDSQQREFSSSIIPYTYKHTNFHLLKKGDLVNVEFDIFGKYIYQFLRRKNPPS